MVSGQQTFNILRRQLLINTCTLLRMFAVVLHVSAPYRRTDLTFELKSLTLMLVDSCLESHTFFNCRNAALALPILAL
uniref:SJCHGC09829 protein n=1 Tax=Schistosoma japonicum TaxID=6182 RepID=Q5BQS2_SCHJA|nr:SJCHGC09829 protein [Schistosoma japonicum]